MGNTGQQLVPNQAPMELPGENIARDHLLRIPPQTKTLNLPGVAPNNSLFNSSYDRQQPRDDASAIAAAALRIAEGNAGTNPGRHSALSNLETIAGVDASQLQSTNINSPPNNLAALVEPNHSLGLPTAATASSALDRLVPNGHSLNSNSLTASSSFDPNSRLVAMASSASTSLDPSRLAVMGTSGSSTLDHHTNSRLVSAAPTGTSAPPPLDANTSAHLGVSSVTNNTAAPNTSNSSENGSDPKVADLENIIARGRNINALLQEIQSQDERNRLLRDLLW